MQPVDRDLQRQHRKLRVRHQLRIRVRAWFGLRGETFDAYCKRVIAGHRGIVHIPLDFQPEPDEFSPDGFHPSEAGYRRFGHLAAEHIANEFKASRQHMA